MVQVGLCLARLFICVPNTPSTNPQTTPTTTTTKTTITTTTTTTPTTTTGMTEGGLPVVSLPYRCPALRTGSLFNVFPVGPAQSGKCYELASPNYPNGYANARPWRNYYCIFSFRVRMLQKNKNGNKSERV